jgi:hypothetical protein
MTESTAAHQGVADELTDDEVAAADGGMTLSEIWTALSTPVHDFD